MNLVSLREGFALLGLAILLVTIMISLFPGFYFLSFWLGTLAGIPEVGLGFFTSIVTISGPICVGGLTLGSIADIYTHRYRKAQEEEYVRSRSEEEASQG